MGFIKIKSMACPMCGESKEFMVTEKQWEMYKNNEFIQHCFPEMDASDRERFITGICPKCWKKIF